jgi:hypothetical protein
MTDERSDTPRDRPMTLIEHLEELRVRLTRSVIGLLAATLVGFIFVDPLLGLLLRPTGNMKLTTLTVLEPFLVKVKIAFLFGLAVAMPWIMYQVYAFVAPALTDNERRRTIPLAAPLDGIHACAHRLPHRHHLDLVGSHYLGLVESVSLRKGEHVCLQSGSPLQERCRPRARCARSHRGQVSVAIIGICRVPQSACFERDSLFRLIEGQSGGRTIQSARPRADVGEDERKERREGCPTGRRQDA